MPLSDLVENADLARKPEGGIGMSNTTNNCNCGCQPEVEHLYRPGCPPPPYPPYPYPCPDYPYPCPPVNPGAHPLSWTMQSLLLPPPITSNGI